MYSGRFRVLALACTSLPLETVMGSTPEPMLQRWVARVAARNETAHAVAAAKFPVQRPIEDPAREEQVLRDKRLRAEALGLDPEDVASAYRQFIEANKLVQHVDFQRYHLGVSPPPAPPLKEIRQRIDAIDRDLLEQWPQMAAVRTHPECGRQLADAIRRVSVPDDTAAGVVLVRALVGFCRPPS